MLPLTKARQRLIKWIKNEWKARDRDNKWTIKRLSLHGIIAQVCLRVVFLPTVMWLCTAWKLMISTLIFSLQHTGSLPWWYCSDNVVTRYWSGSQCQETHRRLGCHQYAGCNHHTVCRFSRITSLLAFGWSDPAFFLSLSVLSVLQVRKQASDVWFSR